MLEGRRSLREYRPSSNRSSQESFCTLHIMLRLAQVGTSVDSKASRLIDEVVSEESDTKGYAA